MSTSPSVVALAERIGHPFADVGLLARALCHRSWCAENAGFEPNERLEFLGDAVLGLIVADHVFTSFPDRDEGWLSRARSTMVRASALAEMATELRLGEALLLGKGEDASGGREKSSILADALEAVIGAVYLDGGWPAARRLVLNLIDGRLLLLHDGRGDTDDKSLLQELATRRFHEPPRYMVTEDGPEHDKTFVATVLLGGQAWGEGVGRSKKQAEQEAASIALAALGAPATADAPLDAADLAPAAAGATSTPSPTASEPRARTGDTDA